MDLLRLIVGLLSLALVGMTSSATLSLEDYWRSVLPNTQIPKAIQAILFPPKSVVTGDTILHPDNDVTQEWCTSNDQILYNPNVTSFFLKDELHPGNTVKLNFTMTNPAGISSFLPRKEAETIPFSSDSFSNVMKRFSVLPGSGNEQVMKKTIGDCERPALIFEEKYCATSLESMIDYSVSQLGTNVQALSTEVDKEEKEINIHKETPLQKIIMEYYTITGNAEKIGSDDAILCHKKPYLYAVFYCHAAIGGTSVYRVPLVGTDGRKALAIAVCHIDTSKWEPKYFGLLAVKTKPGTPICHFVMEGHVIWVRT